MRLIVIVEPGGVLDNGEHFPEGAEFHVPDSIALEWCAAGWARDPSGELETGPRERGTTVLRVAGG